MKTLIQNQNREEEAMNAQPIQQRINLQKVLVRTFGKELQTLDSELQSILVDDMITAFYNRYRVLKRNQELVNGGK